MGLNPFEVPCISKIHIQSLDSLVVPYFIVLHIIPVWMGNQPYIPEQTCIEGPSGVLEMFSVLPGIF